MGMLVAHMMGDYFFQNTWMAVNKTQKGDKGFLACWIHCTIYTLCVGVLCGWIDWRLTVVFFSHYFMDRFRLAKYWRRLFSKDEDFPWIITADNSIHLLILFILDMF